MGAEPCVQTRAISQQVLQISISIPEIDLKIAHLKLQPHITGTNELIELLSSPWILDPDPDIMLTIAIMVP